MSWVFVVVAAGVLLRSRCVLATAGAALDSPWLLSAAQVRMLQIAQLGRADHYTIRAVRPLFLLYGCTQYIQC